MTYNFTHLQLTSYLEPLPSASTNKIQGYEMCAQCSHMLPKRFMAVNIIEYYFRDDYHQLIPTTTFFISLL